MANLERRKFESHRMPPVPMQMSPEKRLCDRAAGLLLAAAALLPLLLVMALVATLAAPLGARAETAACGGANLVERWRTGDPARLAAMEAEAARVENGTGIFWKIERAGLPPSYLLGTMHVTDPRVLAMPDGAREAFAQANTVIVESDEILDEKKASAALLARPDLTMFTDGRGIEDFLDAGQKRVLAEGLKARGVPLPLVAKMKPWMIASFVALPACELSRKAAGAPFLDQKLAEDAVAGGKRLKGLETMVEQIEALDALPVEFHVSALVETLQLGDRAADVMETTTDLYLQGRIGAVMPMLKAASNGADAGSGSETPAFEQRIITDRNHIMATRARETLDAGNAFMAVGALHLPGPEGLVELLRRQGFAVTRMP